MIEFFFGIEFDVGQNQNNATIKLKNGKIKDRKPRSQHLGLLGVNTKKERTNLLESTLDCWKVDPMHLALACFNCNSNMFCFCKT
jgi:hypothetical protein